MEHEAIQLLDTLDTRDQGLRPASAKIAAGTHGITPPLAAS
jgi:biopolymer transport protein ExbB